MKESHYMILLGIIAVLLVALLWRILTTKDSTYQADPVSKYRGFSSETNPWDPPRIIDSILTSEECEYLIKKATPKFGPSMVVGSAGPAAARTSETAWLEPGDPVVDKIMKKAQELTGKPASHCESLQVVRYKPGTYYRSHHDSCCDATDSCIEFEKMGGQRVGTLLVYLNSDFKDGETHFPQHGDLKLKADPGSAIFFKPLDDNSAKCHPKALHAGLPISSGTKYVCNAWVRERPTR